MKRLFCLIFVLLLLCGCTTDTPESTQTTTLPVATQQEQSAPWIEAAGSPWDTEGALTELALTIPDGLHFSTAVEFDGDLLLWSVDSHLQDSYILEMCLIELDDGTILAQKDIPFSEMVSPQILGDKMYLCDGFSGSVLEIDKSLSIVQSWNLDPCEGSWYMSGHGAVYVYDWDGSAFTIDLETGDTAPVLEGDPYVSYMDVSDRSAMLEYNDPESGAGRIAVVDMLTGDVIHPPIRGRFSFVDYQKGTWLCSNYYDSYTAFVGTDNGAFQYADLGYDALEILDENTLMRTVDDGCTISLHTLDGKAIASCRITEREYSHMCSAVIPSDQFGGYFLVLSDYEGSIRLLYWDATHGNRGEDIDFSPIPELEEAQKQILDRVEQMQNEYGLVILTGSDCTTSFFDFTADPVTDWADVSAALDTLENALSVYPEGFFKQLRYDTIHSIEIHLMGTLYAIDPQEYVSTYTAFVQEEYDKFTMGVDIYSASEQTYYHEFSHMIDAYLAWDSMMREDALFSEERWIAMNPDWFPGYTYTYSQECYLVDDSSFIDSYSTVKPTEDRARIMEYAMIDYGYNAFEGNEVLTQKLDYYCCCIRDAFDTTLWGDTLPWEQYLP